MLATSKAKPRRTRPGKYTAPPARKYVLTEESLTSLRDQILIVLADYQSCKMTECYSCHALFVESLAKCTTCGADHHGFSRHQGIRLEVADRILANLKLLGAP